MKTAIYTALILWNSTVESFVFPFKENDQSRGRVLWYRNSEYDNQFNVRAFAPPRKMNSPNKLSSNKIALDSVYELARAFESVLHQKATLKKKISEFQNKRNNIQGILSGGRNPVLKNMDEEISRLSMILNTVTKRITGRDNTVDASDIMIQTFGSTVSNKPETQMVHPESNDEFPKLKQELHLKIQQLESKIVDIQEQIHVKEEDLVKYEMMQQNYKQIKSDLDEAQTTLQKNYDLKEGRDLNVLTKSLVGALVASESEMTKMKNDAVTAKKHLEQQRDELKLHLDKVNKRLSNGNPDVITIMQGLWMLRDGQF
jgi:DNA repair exonuclease SbcCD ATPase subunit